MDTGCTRVLGILATFLQIEHDFRIRSWFKKCYQPYTFPKEKKKEDQWSPGGKGAGIFWG